MGVFVGIAVLLFATALTVFVNDHTSIGSEFVE